MKNSSKFILAGLILGGLWWFNEKKSLAQIKATIRSINFKDGKLSLIFYVINPSAIAVSVSSIIGDIFLNNNNIATVQGLSTQTIAANTATNIIVTVSVNPIGVLTLGTAIWKAKSAGKNVIVQFSGTMKANGLVVPISQSAQII